MEAGPSRRSTGFAKADDTRHPTSQNQCVVWKVRPVQSPREKLASSEGMDALSLDPSFDGSETKIQQSNADVERLGLKS